MDERVLITRVIVNDDQQAFTTLVRYHQQPIRQFLQRLAGGNWALADDLAQQVFLKAYTNLSSFRAEASFSTWLHKIAYHQFLNEIRKAHYQCETPLTEQDARAKANSSVENTILMEQLMTQLSLPERTCLTLAFSAGMSHQEIVNVTELPLGTVKSHINRAKQKLNAWLQASEVGSTV
ncbi:sigma-70 family RNA polymerase sigma factor [Pseudidiomarina sediminum]|uniref:sigma-70 family RNA polymerase sigma factor n=1 Tax=Pseudidiomarina sediminum TaxID=431675 RepID=UPI001C974101|nr:sigma-70 family RNA polymerase sigma factor [Pseudidiomarina sediminum]MBY6064685.1 sigma-70 family RNA polymerase sigma factor [Pseudidiomarina sediminum]